METTQSVIPHGDLPARRYCDSPRKEGRGPCRNPAGFKTAHPGQGRCFLHGGNAKIKHGRYSPIVRPRTAELMSELSADPNPLDIMPEVHLVRALTVELLEQYQDKEGDAARLVDASRMASETTKMVERILKCQQARSVPFGLFGEFFHKLRDAIRTRVGAEQHHGIDADFEHAMVELCAKLDMRTGVHS